MRKAILSLSLLFLTGCQSFYVNQAIKAENRHIENKLPNLELIFENEKSIKSWKPNENLVKVNTPFATLFYREVENNLIDSYGDSKGYITLTPIFHTNEYGGSGYTVLSLLSMTTFNLLGMPFSTRSSFCELEARVLNKDGKIIKKYSAESKVKKYVAIWAYDEYDAEVAALYGSYKNTLGNIIEQIDKDHEFLNDKLNEKSAK
ncbi:MAG: hypothetical protein GY793_08515 [Proteobacteria bacterium]|nr:hypothetical protein [Pseudomonadota bacterium]